MFAKGKVIGDKLPSHFRDELADLFCPVFWLRKHSLDGVLCEASLRTAVTLRNRVLKTREGVIAGEPKANDVSNNVAVAKRTSMAAKITARKAPGSKT